MIQSSEHNFFFISCSSPCYSTCQFNKIRLTPSKIHWDGPGWFECFTENKPCKQLCARTSVPCACLPHGLQCLRVRGAVYPSLLKHLVILSFLRVPTGTVICCFNSMITVMYPVGMNVPLKTNRANNYSHVPPCHERVWRTVCSVGAYGARVVRHFLSNS